MGFLLNPYIVKPPFTVVITGTENTLTQITGTYDSSTLGFSLRTDGYTYDFDNTAESETFANWGSPAGTGEPGDEYWARVTATITDNTPGVVLDTGLGDDFGVWNQLNERRNFGYKKSAGATAGTNEVEFLVEIATDSDGSNIVGTVTWIVRRTYVD